MLLAPFYKYMPPFPSIGSNDQTLSGNTGNGENVLRFCDGMEKMWNNSTFRLGLFQDGAGIFGGLIHKVKTHLQNRKSFPRRKIDMQLERKRNEIDRVMSSHTMYKIALNFSFPASSRLIEVMSVMH